MKAQKILVWRADHLGDLILTTPLLRALDSKDHKVDVLAWQAHLPALDGLPFIHERFALEEWCPHFPRRWIDLVIECHHRRYDRIIIPFVSRKEQLIVARLSCLRVMAMRAGLLGRILGVKCLRMGLPDRRRYYADISLDFARALEVPCDDPVPDWKVNEEERAAMQSCLYKRFKNRPIAVINPFCQGNTCNLPLAEYVTLIRKCLDQTSYGVVVTGLQRDKTSLLTSLSDQISNERLWVSAGELNLRELGALIELASVTVTVGTGPLHIAAALRKPTVSPFCQYVGVCKEVWGNPHSSAQVVEPSVDFCEARRADSDHCQFEGGLSLDLLFQKIVQIARKEK
ncbi:MAG: glycosyltransferase family 9 protein [Bacteroidota bacterium]